MFPEAPSSAIIGPSLWSHLGNIGSYFQDRLAKEATDNKAAEQAAAKNK